MTDCEILDILKVDLLITTDQQNFFLLNLIQTARGLVEEEGIDISSDIGDGFLIERYAAYLYRQRSNPQPMPRDLRWALNNRLFSQKGKVNADG